jgi:hypothetical protein
LVLKSCDAPAPSAYSASIVEQVAHLPHAVIQPLDDDCKHCRIVGSATEKLQSDYQTLQRIPQFVFERSEFVSGFQTEIDAARRHGLKQNRRRRNIA